MLVVGQIRVLPTVVLLIDGIKTDQIQGFEELSLGMEKGREDEFPTTKVSTTLSARGGKKIPMVFLIGVVVWWMNSLIFPVGEEACSCWFD